MTWFRRTSLWSHGPMSLGRTPLCSKCGTPSTLGGIRKHGEEGIGQLGHLFVRAPWDLLPLFRPQLPKLLQPSTSHLGTKHSIHESASEHCIFKPQSWYCVMLRKHESLWDFAVAPKSQVAHSVSQVHTKHLGCGGGSVPWLGGIHCLSSL